MAFKLRYDPPKIPNRWMLLLEESPELQALCLVLIAFVVLACWP